MGDKWTPADVEAVLIDPRTVGVGGYPAIVTDDVWLRVNRKMIKELGPHKYLSRLLRVLRDPSAPDWVRLKEPKEEDN